MISSPRCAFKIIRSPNRLKDTYSASLSGSDSKVLLDCPAECREQLVVDAFRNLEDAWASLHQSFPRQPRPPLGQVADGDTGCPRASERLDPPSSLCKPLS